MRRKYDVTTMFPGMLPKMVLPGDEAPNYINTNEYGGVGLTEEWMKNMPFFVHNFYENNISSEKDPKYFVWNIYAFFVEKFNFVIEFDYLNRESARFGHDEVVRGNIYVNDEFIVGLNWTTNKWKLIQQLMIHFLHNCRIPFFDRHGHISIKQLKERDTKISTIEDILT